MQLGLGRLQYGVIGAILAVPAVILFFLGAALRSCLPDRPELVFVMVFELSMYGFVISVPAILVGFLIGFFVRFRLAARTAALFTLLLFAAAFAAGYVPPRGNCLPM